MATYLTTWNPSKWHWDPADYAATVAATGQGRPVPGGWSVGNRRGGITPGDRLFHLRQESERGIIGSGIFTSDVYQDAHWDGSGRLANYADFDWDVLVDTADRLPIEDLKAEVGPFSWDRIQAGGVEIPTPAAERLEALWAQHLGMAPFHLPDDVTPGILYPEGAVSRVEVNRYERDLRARQACLTHWGHACVVCDIDFEAVYGDIGRGYIHVHHLDDLAAVGSGYVVDPVKDLRPVCPNCHAMLHQQKPALNPEELRKRLSPRRPQLSATPPTPRRGNRAS